MKLKKSKRFSLVQIIEKSHAEGMAKLKIAYDSEASQQMLEKIDQVLEIELSERMTTSGGKAICEKKQGEYFRAKILINAKLHELNPNQLEATYLHELGHIVANFMTNSSCGHGPVWVAVMKQLGASAERCHSMDVSMFARKTKLFKYACVKCAKEYQLTKHKHMRAERAALQLRHAYQCNKCYGKLEFRNE